MDELITDQLTVVYVGGCRAKTVSKHFYYILINEILRDFDEIKCIFSFSVFSLQ
jgi:hypothetical protein